MDLSLPWRDKWIFQITEGRVAGVNFSRNGIQSIRGRCDLKKLEKFIHFNTREGKVSLLDMAIRE